jgi:hypothetical protein
MVTPHATGQGPQDASRLTVRHLLFWMTGVATAIVVHRGIRWLYLMAFHASGQAIGIPKPDTGGFVVALAYGTAVALSTFTVRQKGFWKSPGKILLLVLALMCLIDWGINVVVLSYATLTGDLFPGIQDL